MNNNIVWVKKFSNLPGVLRCVTHCRRFHADDMFATLIIAYAHGNTIEVMTTRESVYTYDLMYDRGFEKFDHHQPGGNGKRPNGVPYASSGLIWREYGRDAIRNMRGLMSNQQIDFAWEIIDRELIQGIDASDNGYKARIYENGYESMNISKIVGILNYIEGAVDQEQNNDQQNEFSFYTIINIIKPIFHAILINAIERAIAVDEVIEAYKKTQGEVLVLDKKIPWQEGLSQIDIIKRIKYVILPARNGDYKVKAVNKLHNSYEVQKPFPESWWGLPTDKLVKVTGVEDIIFCHKGYVCGCKTLEGALKIAQISLQLELAS